MTDRYEETCGCTDCVTVLGVYIGTTITIFFGTDLKKTWYSFLPGSCSWSNANKKLTKFLDEDEQIERSKDVLNLLQCQPYNEAFPDLVHCCCAKGACKHCLKMRPHPVLMRSNQLILFHAYKVVTTCTEHGVLSAESYGCSPHCDSKREGERLGKQYQKRQLVLERIKYTKNSSTLITFQCWWNIVGTCFIWWFLKNDTLGTADKGFKMVSSTPFKTLLKDLHFGLRMKFKLSTLEALALCH